MRSSIVVPIVLIVCLLALALLISRAFVPDDLTRGLPEDNSVKTTNTNIRATDSAFLSQPRAESSDRSLEEPEELIEVQTRNEEDQARETSALSSPSPYFVIAGSFRQLSGAEARVSELKGKGFSTAEVSNFDRGTYAVALVGRSDDYGMATTLAQRVREAGFEARVYRRR